MNGTIFSLKTLAIGWAGLLTAMGAGVVALQMTQPMAAPQSVIVAAAPVVEAPAAETAAAIPAPTPVVALLPFQNRSLVALLPPPNRTVAPLPIPPLPPLRHVARLEPQRVVPVETAAATLPYEQYVWGRFREPNPRYQPYAYAGPPGFGW